MALLMQERRCVVATYSATYVGLLYCFRAEGMEMGKTFDPVAVGEMQRHACRQGQQEIDGVCPVLGMLTDGPLTSSVLIHCCICPNGLGAWAAGRWVQTGSALDAPVAAATNPTPYVALGQPQSASPNIR